MNVPPISAGWDFETNLQIVRLYEFEAGQFDYKEVLNASGSAKDSALASLRRTVCSMANADGGYVLFGILDRNRKVAAPEGRIVGIPIQNDLLKEFSDKIKVIQPDVPFEALPSAVPLPSDNSRGVFVVYISQSQRRPHMLSGTGFQGAGVFYRRGAGGTAETMRLHEIREQMIHTEDRLQQIVLLRLELTQYRNLAELLLGASDAQLQGTIRRFDASGFKPLLATVCGLLPEPGSLLADLLEVPMYTGAINRLLDIPQVEGRLAREIEFGGETAQRWRRRVRDELGELKALCERCDQQLECIFGPYGGRDPGPSPERSVIVERLVVTHCP
jgi:hypothetical protein